MKKIAIFALVSVMVVSVLLVIKNQSAEKRYTKKEAAVSGEKQEAVNHKVLSFELEGLTDKGDKQWEVKGESAESVSENEVRLDNIVAKAYGEEAEATITAKSGIYDKVKNSVRLENDVNAVIENVPGADNNMMAMPSGDLAKAAPTPPVSPDSAKKEPAKERTKTVITCDGGVEFNYEQNLAYFNKNVKVESDYANIDADKITVHLDPKSKRMQEIVCEGNVKISKGDNVTYTDKATYIESEKRIVLTGRPKLVIYQDGNVQDGNFMGDFGKTGK